MSLTQKLYKRERFSKVSQGHLETLRTFIALELPDHLISSFVELQNSLKSQRFKIRWTKPENIHLTLKFLGNIQHDDIEKIDRAMIESLRKFTPISITAKGIGVFPNLKQPRVIWVGISGCMDVLVGLHQTLSENLEKIGFPKDNRPFKGHLTLGRVKTRPDPKKFIAALQELNTFESETYIANTITFFKSDLKSTGPVYTKLSSVFLVNGSQMIQRSDSTNNQ